MVATAGPGPLLSVRDVAVRFGEVVALRQASLRVAPGELVALAGENGAGKSTLVRCIAGDTAPTSGQITVAGETVTSSPGVMSRRGVSVVWQDLALCDNLDVAANLLLGREGRWLLGSPSRSHARARAHLGALGIAIGDTSTPVGCLSGGQRQLLAVARAMLDEPRLLILDEPTAALGVAESAQVEQLVRRLHERGTTILLVSHDLEQMFRLADRIVVLRHGSVVAETVPATAHPDDVIAYITGQAVDASARTQLSRLGGLVDRLAAADPSSSLTLILSALGTAIGQERLVLHILDGGVLHLESSLGLPAPLRAALASLPTGAAGGPVGRAAEEGRTVVEPDLRADSRWPASAGVGACFSVPVLGSGGVVGVITVLRGAPGSPSRDALDLVTLYAGHAAAALERERLLGEVTGRNRILETIREVLETLAGQPSAATGLGVALRAVLVGVRAEEAGLVCADPDSGTARWRASADRAGVRDRPSGDLAVLAGYALDSGRAVGSVAETVPAGRNNRIVAFGAAGMACALVARWGERDVPEDATALLGDAARSFRLALEREEAERAHQETAALRRSQELQREFLSRLSHELRTPLTAIRGYASSLMQPDVTWDGPSQQRFLERIAVESARLGRLVDDLLDFSAMESAVFRLHPDWCELPLVLEAAVACLAPEAAGRVEVHAVADLPAVWADHDRLEQVFVNLLDNALRHNPPGTRVRVGAATAPDGGVDVCVVDDGDGVPDDLLDGPVGATRVRRGPTSGAGLGLSITRGIVDAHGGTITVERLARGTRFSVHLPCERAEEGVLAGD
jgi:signal transduction histidine kinase/ABC-type multidrug transport system ATPase subunit